MAPVRWSATVAGALAYVSIAASIVAYRSWGLGVAEGGPALAAIFNNLTPLATAVLSGLVLGEWPQPYHGAAFALIAGSIVVSTRLPRSSKPAPKTCSGRRRRRSRR